MRVLVMRLWPRGIKKSAVDLWLKHLGAEVKNIRAFKAGSLGWTEMRKRYLAGLRRGAASVELAALERLAGERPVTILCSCEDERRCHRGILKSLLRSGGPRRGRSSVP